MYLYVHMAENGLSPEGTLSPQEPIRPPEGKRSVINRALNETAKFLFPSVGIARSWLRGDLEEKYGPSGAKKVRAVVSSVGGILDVLRYSAAAGSVKYAVDADSTKTIIGFSVAAGVLLSTNLVHLASKSRLIRETGRKVERGVANTVLGRHSRFKDSSLEK